MLGLRKILEHSQIFALIFQKNIEKVWDIEKFCDVAKFRKNQGKNDRVPIFFYVQFFRWTGLLLTFTWHGKKNGEL